jgi:hypothetical protein
MKCPGWRLAANDERVIRNCLRKFNKTKAILTNRDRQESHYVTLRDAFIIARRCTVSAFNHSDTSLTCDELTDSLLMMSLLICIGVRGGDLAWSFEGQHDQALQLQDVELSLNEGGVSLADVTLWMCITNDKGN